MYYVFPFPRSYDITYLKYLPLLSLSFCEIVCFSSSPDRVRGAVLPPEEDNPPRPEGGEPPARLGDEHQDRRLWILQRVPPGQQAGHLLREPAVRGAGAVPGQGGFRDEYSIGFG